MTKIYYAGLYSNGITDAEGHPCEWVISESAEAEYGEEWNGDVKGYILNAADDADAVSVDMEREYHGAIHNLPNKAIILTGEDGQPYEVWWAETKLSQLFNRSDLKQRELAEKAGITLRAVQKLLAGDLEIERTALSTAIKIADALGVDVKELA